MSIYALNQIKFSPFRLDDWTPSNESQLVNLVNRQKATVLYFSIADNFLYTWLVVPTKGVIKFHQVELAVTEEGTILDEHLQNVRESLGKLHPQCLSACINSKNPIF